MHVFITGASGHLGSAVVPELLAAGHAVTGLARSDASAAAIEAMGADVRRGDLGDLDTLREAASQADGVVHLAFRHDLMQKGDMATAAAVDLAALGAFSEALAGTDKPLVGTGGTLGLAMLNLGRTATEADAAASGYRFDAETFVIGLAERGVRASVVRLPPTVHSALDAHGFVPSLIAMARTHGRAAYVDDGMNRWAAGHTLDAARLYRLALESAPAGTRLHAVGDEGIAFREIAEAIARRLGIPAVSVTADDAAESFGFLAPFVGLDAPATSEVTRSVMGWAPREVGLLEDLRLEHYFAVATP
jgi:nucleoside-diphosphate-sugar epimerase